MKSGNYRLPHLYLQMQHMLNCTELYWICALVILLLLLFSSFFLAMWCFSDFLEKDQKKMFSFSSILTVARLATLSNWATKKMRKPSRPARVQCARAQKFHCFCASNSNTNAYSFAPPEVVKEKKRFRYSCALFASLGDVYCSGNGINSLQSSRKYSL